LNEQALITLAATLTALAVALVMRALVPPTPRLAGRVRPYAPAARRAFGMRVAPPPTGSPVRRALLGLGAALVPKLWRGGGSADERLGRRLRQSGLFPGLEAAAAIDAFRVKQLGALFVGLGAAVMVSLALELPGGRALALAGLGAMVGLVRQRGRIDRAIEDRRQQMRIEIYTVNQLLAMRVRVGGGVVYAVQQLVGRGRGEVVSELAEGLRLHRAGMRASDAFARLAQLTPEPACARTYSLLAAADDRGADLAGALLALSEDIREGRREAMRRTATKRRAAMLIPIIAILAPVMLLFVGAPLPQLVFNWR
jgi:tight adherence protein C